MIGMELSPAVTGAPAAATGSYQKLGDAGDDEEAAHEAAPLITQSDVEQIRDEDHQVMRTVFVPTFCVVGFVVGCLTVFAICKMADGTDVIAAAAAASAAHGIESMTLTKKCYFSIGQRLANAGQRWPTPSPIPTPTQLQL